jgi:hypothetical protein
VIHGGRLVGKNKRAAKTKTLTRKATFIRGRHLVIDKAGAPVRTLNVVQRAALNPDPPTEEGGEWGSTDVFFKAHDDQDAASQYAVASTRLARFLGMPNLIARNAFAKVKNVLGVVSGAVPGSPLVSREKKKEVPVPEGYDQQDIRDWVRAGQREERDGKYYETSREIHQWVNFKEPRIQKGMSDLQLFDAITGQIDRHGGNIFVDPKTGTVSGIDDDKAFGKGRPAGERQAQPGTGDHQHYRALPALVDEDTAERILALDPTKLPDVLLSRVNDSKVLTDKEIEDAMRRFQGVRQYLRQLKRDGALVGQNRYPSWNDATYQQALQDPTHSYLGDQAKELERVIQLAANDPEFEVLNAPPLQPPPPSPVAPATTTTATALPQPPPVMPPLPPPPWQGLRQPSPRTGGVPPLRAAQVRLAATRREPGVRTRSPVVVADDSDDSSEDSISLSEE